MKGIDPYGLAHILCVFAFLRQEQTPALQASAHILCVLRIGALYVLAPVVCVCIFCGSMKGIDPYGLAHILCVLRIDVL